MGLYTVWSSELKIHCFPSKSHHPDGQAKISENRSVDILGYKLFKDMEKSSLNLTFAIRFIKVCTKERC